MTSYDPQTAAGRRAIAFERAARLTTVKQVTEAGSTVHFVVPLPPEEVVDIARIYEAYLAQG